MTKLDFSMWAIDLKKYLKDHNDERQHDNDFINGRSDAAAAEFEAARREGCTEHQAAEWAHHVLMKGV